MKTGNILSIAALIICGMVCVNSAKAQDAGTKSDQVTVNIKFKPVQSIVVTPGEKTVDLVYAKREDYETGVSKELKDHLTVFSTGGFQVNVKSNGNFLKTGGATADFIESSHLKITAALGTDTEIGSFKPQNLSTTDQYIITATEGGKELKYNVTYDNTEAGNEYKYINRYVHEDDESVYTAQITYTIVTN